MHHIVAYSLHRICCLRDERFLVKQGPVFANFVLADEINRAPAKVQSALLEAMQEKQVTIGSESFNLPNPFLVMATQNPIEQEGTYPLPEAQMDRFMLKVVIGYPTIDEEKKIIRENIAGALPTVTPVTTASEIVNARAVVREVYIDEKIEQYIADIVFATRYPDRYGLKDMKEMISFGGSPRASINLAKAARAYAFIKRRGYVVPRKVRKIEIKARGLSSNVFAGQYHSAFKGRGMAFSEVREYQYGDDVRDIDWNVTARFHRPYVKVFEEERELTVMLLIDVSGSLDFGTQRQMKRDMVTEIAATIAFSAIQNNDKIGVVFFSDRIEKYIPPKKGRKHILYIIREMLDFHPESRRTDVKQALEFLTSIAKRRCTAFVLSDFYVRQDFLQTLQICNRKHDVVALQVYDVLARQLPDVGLMRVVDAETGHEQYIDTGSRKLRQAHENYWRNRQQQLHETMNKSNVDLVSIATNEDYVKALLMLFKQRS